MQNLKRFGSTVQHTEGDDAAGGLPLAGAVRTASPEESENYASEAMPRVGGKASRKF